MSMGHFMDDQEIEGHAKARATGKPAEVDLCAAPGATDFTFGAMLSAMIGMAFQRVDGNPRYYTECRFCEGTDEGRPTGQRSRIDLVQHKPGCSMEHHLPRLRAMANKDVT